MPYASQTPSPRAFFSGSPKNGNIAHFFQMGKPMAIKNLENAVKNCLAGFHVGFEAFSCNQQKKMKKKS
jgi:hypothetical protein